MDLKALIGVNPSEGRSQVQREGEVSSCYRSRLSFAELAGTHWAGVAIARLVNHQGIDQVKPHLLQLGELDLIWRRELPIGLGGVPESLATMMLRAERSARSKMIENTTALVL